MVEHLAYRFPHFTLTHDPRSGLTVSAYPDGSASRCPVVPEDKEHAMALGITVQRHRLEHELWHHLIGCYVLMQDSSPVIRVDATGKDPKKELGEAASLEEWLVTAFTYHMHGRPRDYGALIYAQKQGVDPEWLLEFGAWLVDAADQGRPIGVVVGE